MCLCGNVLLLLINNINKQTFISNNQHEKHRCDMFICKAIQFQ